MQEQNDEVEWRKMHMSCLDVTIELTNPQLQWLQYQSNHKSGTFGEVLSRPN